MQIVTDRCPLCDPWLILLRLAPEIFATKQLFMRHRGVKVGIAADHCGMGFEPVFDIGSQRLDGDMQSDSIGIKFQAIFGNPNIRVVDNKPGTSSIPSILVIVWSGGSGNGGRASEEISMFVPYSICCGTICSLSLIHI